MVDVLTQIDIDSPINKVAGFATEPDNAPLWYVNIKAVAWKTPKPITLGSQIAFKAHFLGRELSYVYQIEELIPGQKLVMRTADGPFPMETTYTWEIIEPNKTRMTLRNRGKPSGFSKIFAPFMSLAMKNANRKDLKKLKRILEKK